MAKIMLTLLMDSPLVKASNKNLIDIFQLDPPSQLEKNEIKKHYNFLLQILNL
jgi:hypothetical protein